MSAPVTKIWPADEYSVLTKNDTTKFEATRALLVATAGTANLTQPDGTDVNDVPLVAGYNPISTIKLRTGGTADGVWALR